MLGIDAAVAAYGAIQKARYDHLFGFGCVMPMDFVDSETIKRVFSIRAEAFRQQLGRGEPTFTEKQIAELGLDHIRGCTLAGVYIPRVPCRYCGVEWSPEKRNGRRCSRCGGTSEMRRS